ncbi:MAG: hypothetical protein JSW26_00555 [Desulfobacterales bacterium]|nr:MAG: hypothetical protein JSW26_00555 [Desulfobacterales bacterium]
MTEQVYFDDIAQNQEIPPLNKRVTTINILMYLSTVWLMDRIHFDHPFATKRRGLPDIVAPGNMAIDYYAELLTRWAGGKGNLRKLSTQYRSFMLPGTILECGGKITGKYMKDEKGYAELELWLKNEDGTNCVPGKAVVELPVK